MTFEIIPNDPKEALVWYKEKLEQIKEINQHGIKNGYEPTKESILLMLNYSTNIKHLEKRLKN